MICTNSFWFMIIGVHWGLKQWFGSFCYWHANESNFFWCLCGQYVKVFLHIYVCACLILYTQKGNSGFMKNPYHFVLCIFCILNSQFTKHFCDLVNIYLNIQFHVLFRVETIQLCCSFFVVRSARSYVPAQLPHG